MTLLLKIMMAILAIIVLYVLLSFLIPLIPKHRHFRNHPGGVEVLILSDGIHADVVIPAHHPVMNWWSFLDPGDYQGNAESLTHLGFGWGDKGFYLEIPEWKDLTLKIAAKAMLVPSPSAVHVTAYAGSPPPRKYVNKVWLSTEQYQRLVQYVLSWFTRKGNQPELMVGAGYSPSDNFYEAEGSYHGLTTCNYWTSEALATAGVRTPIWTSNAWGMHWQVGKVEK